MNHPVDKILNSFLFKLYILGIYNRFCIFTVTGMIRRNLEFYIRYLPDTPSRNLFLRKYSYYIKTTNYNVFYMILFNIIYKYCVKDFK